MSGFGPLIVATFGYSPLDAILFQFPLGSICAVGIPLTGYLASRYKNIRTMMLILCCLPVIAGFAMIWKSEWGNRPVTPVVGYSLIGFFGPVVSLIITLGAANVAGETKKSFMAAMVFIAYCVGNIVGPQMIRSESRAEHYPELWTGLMVWYVAHSYFMLCTVIWLTGVPCSYAITILSSMTLYIILARENKRRDNLVLDKDEADRVAFQDLSDRQNLHFRYVL